MKHSPGSYLSDAELAALLTSLRRAILALGQRVEWRGRRYCFALEAEAAWRNLDV